MGEVDIDFHTPCQAEAGWPLEPKAGVRWHEKYFVHGFLRVYAQNFGRHRLVGQFGQTIRGPGQFGLNCQTLFRVE